MKKLIQKTSLAFLGVLYFNVNQAQNPAPAKPQTKKHAIVNATLHTGTGQIIENGCLVFENGKILAIGKTGEISTIGAEITDASGQQVYPGFIAANTNLGLNEIEMVRSTLDYVEVGDLNPNIRSLIAYNTDSRIISTLTVNGILEAEIVPQGGIISGSSSVVQLDAWNWEDAAINSDAAVHINYPDLGPFRGRNPEGAKNHQANQQNQLKAIDEFMLTARAYCLGQKPSAINLKFEAMRPVFNGQRKLFVHVGYVKGIVHAINYFNSLNIKITLVGGEESWMVTDLLKKSETSVILSQVHALPGYPQDDVDLRFKIPFLLDQAGIPFCLSVAGNWQVRNLPFMAGTAAAYGLSKEKAIQAITSNAASILGVGSSTGSLETGKDATLFISKGDALDMGGNQITEAYIQGRKIDLTNCQTQSFQKYSAKYGIGK